MSEPPVEQSNFALFCAYEGEDDLTISTSVGLIVFEFHDISFKTHPGGLVYRYRLKGYDEDWQTTTAQRVEYQNVPGATFTFEVQAVDQDLNYSEPASVTLNVVPDPHIQVLAEALSQSGTKGEFVGNSQALREVQAQLAEVAKTDLTVLISGETGTGKGVATRAVHQLSPRRDRPFIQVNCGALPQSLVESELFGHERGAFTGAVSRKLGKVELAAGGTLFLDEIEDLALEAQVKLLRLLEERAFERVGGTETLVADMRVIAATNRNLQEMMANGQFREDLYFRLQVFPVRLPPLRERREDIPLLAACFVERMASYLNKAVPRLTPEALAVLRTYDWPGNVRELEHAVQRAVILCRRQTIQPKDIALKSDQTDGELSEEILTLKELEKQHIRKVVEQAGWVIKGPHGAAALLGMHPSTLSHRMKKLGIRRP